MSVSPGILYRMREDKKGFDLISAQELFSAIFAIESAKTPENPLAPEILFYCHNENCSVRTVSVFFKFDGEPVGLLNKPTSCPSCREKMTPLEYLNEVMLLPVKKPER